MWSTRVGRAQEAQLTDSGSTDRAPRDSSMRVDGRAARPAWARFSEQYDGNTAGRHTCNTRHTCSPTACVIDQSGFFPRHGLGVGALTPRRPRLNSKRFNTPVER